MIVGIGIDSASISEIARFLEVTPSFKTHTFTEAEQAAAPQLTKDTEAVRHNIAEYYAVRFAAKEAVFKALQHPAQDTEFDLRHVETLNHADGAPYVNITPELKALMDKAGADVLHISATTEGDLANVFVIAEKRS